MYRCLLGGGSAGNSWPIRVWASGFRVLHVKVLWLRVVSKSLALFKGQCFKLLDCRAYFNGHGQ